MHGHSAFQQLHPDAGLLQHRPAVDYHDDDRHPTSAALIRRDAIRVTEYPHTTRKLEANGAPLAFLFADPAYNTSTERRAT